MPSSNPLVPSWYDITWSAIALVAVVLMIVALVSVARTANRLTSWQALIWTLVVIFLPLVGSLSWLFIGRRSASGAPDPLSR